MKNGIFSGYPPFAQLAITAMIALSSLLIITLLGSVLALLIFDINLSVLLKDLTNEMNVDVYKFFLTITSIGFFLLPPIILGYLFTGNSISYLQFDVTPRLRSVFLSVIIVIAALPAINFFAEFNSQLFDYLFTENNWMKMKEEELLEVTEALLNVDSVGGMLFNLFMIAVIPAFGEELLFRGVLQKIFIKWTKNIHIGIIISAILFSALHLQFYGFFPRLMIGIFFGYLLVWTGSIWIPIIAHFINNASVILFTYLADMGHVSEDIDTIGSDDSTILYSVASIVVISVLIYLLHLKEKRVL